MSYSILVIEDDRVFNRLIVEHLGRLDYEVKNVPNWQEAKACLDTHEPDLLMMDVRLPDADGLELLPKISQQFPVIILTAYGSVQNAVRAMKLGAADYLAKPINLEELELVIQRVLENAALKRDLMFSRGMLDERLYDSMIGDSPALEQVRSYVDAVSKSDMTVLVQGESGTGKELVAQLIHQASPRSVRNFVAVDCCTLNEQLFESELFGHEKGAFTSADKQKKGLIEGAGGGSLFLDEIGEIAPSSQAKLLRVIESGIFRRVGGTKDLRANVRIVAATNRDLSAMCQSGDFRADLFFRLSGFVIHVPTLRERREDIPDLVRHFVHHHDFSRRIDVAVSPPAMESLISYSWPGNIRELKNVIERAIILMGDQRELTTDYLVFNSAFPERQATVSVDFDHSPTLDEIEGKYLGMVLKEHSGHRGDSAKALGVSERTLYRLIKKYGYQ
ncbi:MAG: sigma-54 dependent transcriptional regulator [Pseudomonadota bacterium]|nr:sigma-54 dependent transcriptional regulator [Pseudomonadota bacterium]